MASQPASATKPTCNFRKDSGEICKRSVAAGETRCWQHARTWRHKWQSLTRNQTLAFLLPIIIGVPGLYFSYVAWRDANPKTNGLSGFLQIYSVLPVNGQNVLAAGKPLSMTVLLEQIGPQPLQGESSLEELALVEARLPHSEQEPRTKFRQTWRDMHGQDIAAGRIGDQIGIANKVGKTVTIASPSEEAVSGLMNGSWRIYLFVEAAWKDFNGNPGSLDVCFWRPATSGAQLSAHVAWISCD